MADDGVIVIGAVVDWFGVVVVGVPILVLVLVLVHGHDDYRFDWPEQSIPNTNCKRLVHRGDSDGDDERR